LGICSVCLTAQGRLTAFAFGFAQVFTYTYICLRAHLYGEVAINIYYFATMIYGVYLWRRRISPTTQRVITRQLSWSIWFALIIAIAAFSAAIGYGLARFTDDPTPYMDSFTTIVAIVAQVLMIMAYRDQWFLWFVVDIVSVVMWIYVGNYCMAAQYAFWCCNCIYGYIRWTQLSSSKCPNS
jgi:nicotinamide mononucleotide transporter